MLSDEFIKGQSNFLTDLGDRLGYQVDICKRISEANDSKVVKEWANSVRSSCNYGAFLIKLLLASIDSYRHLSEEQFGYYVGKISIQPFLEIINSYEQILNSLVTNSCELRNLLDSRIDKKTSLVNENWDPYSTGKSKELKRNLTSLLQRKIFEMAFIRDTLYKNEIIDNVDHEILTFAWDIRNSMHNNFVALKDINFSYPDIKTGKPYYFKFTKGEELYHPDDLVSFQIISEQIFFILLKILQTYSVKKDE